MVSTLNYDAQKGFRELYQEDRWGVLSVLILHSNGSGRAWPSTKRIMNQLDRSSSIITRARQWLIDHEAIEIVPYEKRTGDELKLPRRQFVYRLTGKVKLGNRYIQYLYIQEPRVEISDDPDDLDPKVSEYEHSESETFRIRNLTVLDSEESISPESTNTFFATLEKSREYAFYIFNEKEKLLCTQPFKMITDVPGNLTEWTSITGTQIDAKKFGEYQLTSEIPHSEESGSITPPIPPPPPEPQPPKKPPIDKVLKDAVATHIERIDPKLAGSLTGILAQKAAGVWRKKLETKSLTEEQYAVVARSIPKFVEAWKNAYPEMDLPTNPNKFETYYAQLLPAMEGKATAQQDNRIPHPEIPGSYMTKSQYAQYETYQKGLAERKAKAENGTKT